MSVLIQVKHFINNNFIHATQIFLGNYNSILNNNITTTTNNNL